MSQIRICSVHLPVREPTAGVTLDAYVKYSEGAGLGHKLVDEGSVERSNDSSFDQTLLRYRWYRDARIDPPANSAVHCHVHPNRPAAFYCGFWKSELSAFGYMFPHACHCSLQCFKENFHIQRGFWEKACSARRTTAERSSSVPRPRNALVVPDTDDGWVVVGTAEKYTPCELDIGHCLQLRVSIINRSSGTELPASLQVFTTAPVQRVPKPIQRLMVPLTLSSTPQKGGRFTVLTYNILAELYATQQAFPTTEAHALLWQYRRQLILQELELYNADIVCLQEVQSTSFHEDLRPEMDKRGYDAVFKKKTQEDILMMGGRYAMDGCATFYRRNRFTLVKKYEVEFNKAAQSYVETISDQSERRKHEHRLMKPNVALILVLEGNDADADPLTEARNLVCIANTHIHSNQDLPDVKLWQVHTLLKGLEKIANSANIPMVLAGDLNCIPGSAPHVLMMRGYVDVGPDQLEADPLQLFRADDGANKLNHSLQLQSAYAMAMQTSLHSQALEVLRSRLETIFHEPMITNITHDFKATLDYICCSHRGLCATALLQLPGIGDLLHGEQNGLPTLECPSDHIALMAEFEFSL